MYVTVYVRWSVLVGAGKELTIRINVPCDTMAHNTIIGAGSGFSVDRRFPRLLYDYYCGVFCWNRKTTHVKPAPATRFSYVERPSTNIGADSGFLGNQGLHFLTHIAPFHYRKFDVSALPCSFSTHLATCLIHRDILRPSLPDLASDKANDPNRP